MSIHDNGHCEQVDVIAVCESVSTAMMSELMRQEILLVLYFLQLEQPVKCLLNVLQAFHQMVSYFPSVAPIVHS